MLQYDISLTSLSGGTSISSELQLLNSRQDAELENLIVMGNVDLDQDEEDVQFFLVIADSKPTITSNGVHASGVIFFDPVKLWKPANSAYLTHGYFFYQLAKAKVPKGSKLWFGVRNNSTGDIKLRARITYNLVR